MSAARKFLESRVEAGTAAGGVVVAYVLLEWIWGLVCEIIGFKYTMPTEVAIAFTGLASYLIQTMLKRPKREFTLPESYPPPSEFMGDLPK